MTDTAGPGRRRRRTIVFVGGTRAHVDEWLRAAGLSPREADAVLVGGPRDLERVRGLRLAEGDVVHLGPVDGNTLDAVNARLGAAGGGEL